MTKPTGQLSPTDELEIEIEAAPPPRRGRARTPNPEVDEIIHTGEIDTARSLVVKSSSNNVPRLDDDRTEVTRKPAQRRRGWMWLVAAGVPAAAAIALLFVESPAAGARGPDASNLEPIARLVGQTLDGDARAVKMRADAIASSSMLRAGISTDASTLADMAKDKDLALPIEPGEVLEVFQISNAGRTLLLRLPADAPQLRSPGAGKTAVESGAPGPTVVAAAEIPKQASGVSGEVVLAAPLDLEPIRKHVAAVGGGVSLVGLGAPIMLVAGAEGGGNAQVKIATTATEAPLALAAQLTVGPAVVDASTGDTLVLARYGCAALAGLFVLLFLVSRVMRRARVVKH